MAGRPTRELALTTTPLSSTSSSIDATDVRATGDDNSRAIVSRRANTTVAWCRPRAPPATTLGADT